MWLAILHLLVVLSFFRFGAFWLLSVWFGFRAFGHVWLVSARFSWQELGIVSLVSIFSCWGFGWPIFVFGCRAFWFPCIQLSRVWFLCLLIVRLVGLCLVYGRLVGEEWIRYEWVRPVGVMSVCASARGDVRLIGERGGVVQVCKSDGDISDWAGTWCRYMWVLGQWWWYDWVTEGVTQVCGGCWSRICKGVFVNLILFTLSYFDLDLPWSLKITYPSGNFRHHHRQ